MPLACRRIVIVAGRPWRKRFKQPPRLPAAISRSSKSPSFTTIRCVTPYNTRWQANKRGGGGGGGNGGTVYLVLCTVHHTAWAVSQGRLLYNQECTNTARYVFGKLSARCFEERRPFWHRRYSSCRDTENGRSTRVCVYILSLIHI